MARETRDERIARTMTEQLTEQLFELKNMVTKKDQTRESDVEMWCQGVLKSCLGYSASAGYEIVVQEKRGKSRPDIVVSFQNKPILVIEVKKLFFDFNKSDFRSGKAQLAEYLGQMSDVTYGILTNGNEWRLYDFSDKANGPTMILSIDLLNEAGTIDLNKKAIEETCWDLKDLHCHYHDHGDWEEWSKEATAFSPETLAKAILTVDVVKAVGKFIKGEHELKASAEVLLDKISELLERGLDDSVPGWNETRQVELRKYVKKQKKNMGKKKRAIKVEQNSDEATKAASDENGVISPSVTDLAKSAA